MDAEPVWSGPSGGDEVPSKERGELEHLLAQSFHGVLKEGVRVLFTSIVLIRLQARGEMHSFGGGRKRSCDRHTRKWEYSRDKMLGECCKTAERRSRVAVTSSTSSTNAVDAGSGNIMPDYQTAAGPRRRGEGIFHRSDVPEARCVAMKSRRAVSTGQALCFHCQDTENDGTEFGYSGRRTHAEAHLASHPAPLGTQSHL